MQQQRRERRNPDWTEGDVEQLTPQGMLGPTDGSTELSWIEARWWGLCTPCIHQEGSIALDLGETFCPVKVNAQGGSQLRAIGH